MVGLGKSDRCTKLNDGIIKCLLLFFVGNLKREQNMQIYVFHLILVRDVRNGKSVKI